MNVNDMYEELYADARAYIDSGVFDIPYDDCLYAACAAVEMMVAVAVSDGKSEEEALADAMEERDPFAPYIGEGKVRRPQAMQWINQRTNNGDDDNDDE